MTAANVPIFFLSGQLYLPSDETSGVRIAFMIKWAANAAPIPGTEGNIPSAPATDFQPIIAGSIDQSITAMNAETIMPIECLESGLYPSQRIISKGTKILPSPYTARTTNLNTESPPGT